jgi:hypothetical protein
MTYARASLSGVPNEIGRAYLKAAKVHDSRRGLPLNLDRS